MLFFSYKNSNISYLVSHFNPFIQKKKQLLEREESPTVYY